MAEAGLEPRSFLLRMFSSEVFSKLTNHTFIKVQLHSFPWVYSRSPLKVREVGQRDTHEDPTTQMHVGTFNKTGVLSFGGIVKIFLPFMKLLTTYKHILRT